jgi:hypothetical protein
VDNWVEAGFRLSTPAMGWSFLLPNFSNLGRTRDEINDAYRGNAVERCAFLGKKGVSSFEFQVSAKPDLGILTRGPNVPKQKSYPTGFAET